MKTDIKYLLKISTILAIIIFVIERLLFAGGFNQPIDELVKVFGIHFMYAFVLSVINGYFFHFLEKKLTWKEHSQKRLIIGAFGSVLFTMIGLVFLRFITFVAILGNPIESFLNDPSAKAYYSFGLGVTLIISLVFHAIFFYKALTENRVNEQQNGNCQV
jgi:hypothetical protein